MIFWIVPWMATLIFRRTFRRWSGTCFRDALWAVFGREVALIRHLVSGKSGERQPIGAIKEKVELWRKRYDSGSKCL